MKRQFLEELRVQGYGCIREATFRLTPFHAITGPNGSGKSTVLRALRTLAYLLSGRERDATEEAALLRAMRTSAGVIRFEASSADATWHVDLKPQAGRMRWTTCSRGERPPSFGEQQWPQQFGPLPGPRPAASLVRALEGARVLRLDPDALRAPQALLPDGEPLGFFDERGAGLPAVYDAILARDIQAFLELNAGVARLFPGVKSISLTNPSPTTKALGVKLSGGAIIPADLMSDGLLYYLAFAALPHMTRTALLLIEEPENGLHRSIIAEVMRVLRGMSGDVQVIMTTHSPLVLDELLPDEVTSLGGEGAQGAPHSR